MEKHVKLRTCICIKGFYKPLGMFGISNTFPVWLRTEVVQRITSSHCIRGESRVYGVFLMTLWKRYRQTHLIHSVCLFKVRNTQLWKLLCAEMGQYSAFSFLSLSALQVGRCCLFFLATSSVFSISKLYCNFDCQFFHRYFQKNFYPDTVLFILFNNQEFPDFFFFVCFIIFGN